MKKITEPFTETQEATNDDEVMYYQGSAEDLEAQYLQETPQTMNEIDEDSSEDLIVLNQKTSGSQGSDSQIIQLGEASTMKSGVTFVNRADLNSQIQMPQEVRVVKRPIQATPAKNVTSKIFIQNTSKGPVVHRNLVTNAGAARQEMSLSHAKRIGLITPKMQQMFSNMGPTRLVVKNVQPGSLIKGPTKILPAPSQKLSRDNIPISIVRTNIPQTQSQLRSIITTSSSSVRPITVTKTVGGLTATKIEGRSPQKVFVRPANVGSGGIKIPLHLAGKQPVQLVKLINSPGGGVSIAAFKPKMVHSPGRIFLNMGSDGNKKPVQMRSSSQFFKRKTYEAVKSSTPKEGKQPEVVTLDDEAEATEGGSKLESRDLLHDDEYDKEPLSPHEIMEANGIRPKKPCNCTRSQCLKLYCECFANGEFCYQCNCNNCFNNIEHEEERQQSIKSCLDRNPAAFQPKIQMADSDDEERRHNKGCNCKRSHCLKNYCECFEAKLTCGKYCKCLSCRNTEEDLAAWEQGDRAESGEEDQATKTSSPYLPQNVAQALCDCILVQAEECERKGEDIVTTELRIIEELGQRLVQLIGNRTKKDSR